MEDAPLLPCPFCGGSAEFGTMGGAGDDTGAQFIQCTEAMCAASSALIWPGGEGPKPLLTKRWNRRATPLTDHAAELLAMLAMLDEWLEPLGKLSDADVDRIHDGPHGLRDRIRRSRALVRKVRGKT
jgi:hypothetical protein